MSLDAPPSMQHFDGHRTYRPSVSGDAPNDAQGQLIPPGTGSLGAQDGDLFAIVVEEHHLRRSSAIGVDGGDDDFRDAVGEGTDGLGERQAGCRGEHLEELLGRRHPSQATLGKTIDDSNRPQNPGSRR